jgi:spore maturation protein SpmB
LRSSLALGVDVMEELKSVMAAISLGVGWRAGIGLRVIARVGGGGGVAIIAEVLERHGLNCMDSCFTSLCGGGTFWTFEFSFVVTRVEL